MGAPEPAEESDAPLGRAAGAGDEFADVEVDEHIKPRNKALLIYETSL